MPFLKHEGEVPIGLDEWDWSYPSDIVKQALDRHAKEAVADFFTNHVKEGLLVELKADGLRLLTGTSEHAKHEMTLTCPMDELIDDAIEGEDYKECLALADELERQAKRIRKLIDE